MAARRPSGEQLSRKRKAEHGFVVLDGCLLAEHDR
jgi:hypothetical protein